MAADWSGRPAYRQVADALRVDILRGTINPGAQLPSYNSLMEQYEVSVTVVRNAIRELRTEGLVRTHQGKGVFVSDPLPKIDPDMLTEPVNVYDEMRAIHRDLHRLEERLERLERAVLGEQPS